MPAGRLRILHAIHDFLPRHQAGSEIYAFELGREQARRHDVTVLCADYDPSRAHGHVTWRAHAGLPVVEIVNNWVCASFAETYRPSLVGEHLAHVLRAIQPDVLHVHNLLNLSFDLPALARRQGIPVVATLHDYTLVCASGGQRLHKAESHRCDAIESERCARCFAQSPFASQMALGRVASAAPGRARRAGLAAARRFPRLARRAAAAARQVGSLPIAAGDIEARLTAAREVFDAIDLFVAPSPSLAGEFERLGLPRAKLRVSDYGFVPLRTAGRRARRGPLRIGYVGTLVWHKGVHILVDAVAALPRGTFTVAVFGDPRVFPEYAAALGARADGLPVDFRGAFTRDNVERAYAEIDVLVVPSLWLENSPLVIHEAFMAGVPVVGARIGGIADLVEHGRSGWLYEPTSSAELAAALADLIEHPERLERFRAALPAVKTIEADARELDAAYAELLDSREPAGSRR